MANRNIIALLAVILFSSLSFSYNLSITASDEVRIGDYLKVMLVLSNTTSSENVSDKGCVVYTLDENNNTVDLVAYDSLINEPPGLSTNEGGRAYLSLLISNKHAVYNTNTVVGDCAGTINSTSFYVLPYSPTDEASNWLLSLTKSVQGWLLVFFGVIFLVWLGIILYNWWRG